MNTSRLRRGLTRPGPVLALVPAAALLVIQPLQGCSREGVPESGVTAQALETASEGSILGLVLTPVKGAQGERSFGLPDVTVYAKSVSGGDGGASVVTDLNGRFTLPSLKNGAYVLCWEARGFGGGCGQEVIGVEGEAAHAAPLQLEAPGPVVYGRVSLTDGSIPNLREPFFEASLDTFVTALDEQGTALGEPVRVNGSGDYVLTGVSTKAAQVEARTEKATQRAPIEKLGEPVRVDVKLANQAPTLDGLLAYDGEQAVRHVKPGTKLSVAVDARDADEDALSFRWNVSGSDGEFRSEDGPRVTWTVPSVEGHHTLYVLVRDGRGGTATGRLDITTGDEERYFAGRVVDAASGEPVKGARVTVNGRSTESEEDGTFVVNVQETGAGYVLNVSQDGYQLYARTETSALIGELIQLVPASRTVIDPAKLSVVVEERKNGKPGTELTFEPGVLVGPDGKPATRPLNVYVATVDPEDVEGRMPGGFAALDAKGQPAVLTTYGAVDVRIRDDEGLAYNVAQGRSVRVRIPVDASLLKSEAKLPEKTPVWYFDEQLGLWREEEGGTWLDGKYYALDARHFSFINVDISAGAPACMRVKIDTTRVQLPVRVRFTARDTANVPHTYTFTADSALNMIGFLRANRSVTLTLLDANNNPLASSTRTLSSGLVALNGSPPYPYTACNSSVTLTLPVPTSGGSLSYIGLDDAASAAAYYSAIGANLPARNTLAAWKTTNGFGAGEDANAVYFNHGDLGFGRWMHMKKKANGDVAYYVSNYANENKAGLAKRANLPSLGLIATVAMEYSPGPLGGGRYTKFYIYDNAGNLTSSANLDGTVKFLPRLCITCHGGSYTPPTTANQGNMGSRFLPFALETFRYPQLSFLFNYSRAVQEPQFKTLNARILDTNASPATREVICGWHGAGAACSSLPNPTQNSNFVPLGWSGNPTLYRTVVQPSCRTCHVARTGSLAWTQWSVFQSFGSSIKYDVCQSRVMPQAKRTYENFWLSILPHQPTSLANAGLSGWAPTDVCPL
ncbi:carboxypeptidase regulatory-like domain-containing protein [Myxococcaceae bacterium GXIMD 01537]